MVSRRRAHEGQAQFVGHQHGQVTPMRWMLGEPCQQLLVGNMEQRTRFGRMGVVGAGRAVKYRNLPEPLGRREQHQYSLTRPVSLATVPGDADGAAHHGIETAGRGVPQEQLFAGLQLAYTGHVQQALGKVRRQLRKPATAAQHG